MHVLLYDKRVLLRVRYGTYTHHYTYMNELSRVFVIWDCEGHGHLAGCKWGARAPRHTHRWNLHDAHLPYNLCPSYPWPESVVLDDFEITRFRTPQDKVHKAFDSGFGDFPVVMRGFKIHAMWRNTTWSKKNNLSKTMKMRNLGKISGIREVKPRDIVSFGTRNVKGTQAWNFLKYFYCRNRNLMVPRACNMRFLKIVFDSAEIFDF